MIDKHLKIFGLNTSATLNEVKRAYRKLAKQNHPDHFIDQEQKKKQEIIMEKINEAYKTIVSNYKGRKYKTKSEESIKKSETENDYSLYKKGIKTLYTKRNQAIIRDTRHTYSLNCSNVK